MPGCIVSAMTASFRSVEKRRRRATPVMTSTFENVSDIGVCLGLYLGPPAKAGVRSKQGAVQCAPNPHWHETREDPGRPAHEVRVLGQSKYSPGAGAHRSTGAARCRRSGDRLMKNRRAEMATGNIRRLRMMRRLLAFIACACAVIGGAPLSFGETSKFEGVYKGQIVLRTAAGSALGGGVSCNPSTTQFEQTMTVSGDRLYLVRKAVQVNIVFS